MARKLSKRMREAAALLEGREVFPIGEALGLLEKYRASCAAKFDETVELVMALGIDPRQSDQAVRGSVILPSGIGKELRIAAFVSADEATKALAAGAHVAGEDDLIDKVKNGFLDFDVCIATPALMPKIAPLGKILGPRNLMPNQRTGTVVAVGEDIAEVIKRVRDSRAFKSDKQGLVHVAVGKNSFSADALIANIRAVYGAVTAAKPAASKGVYMQKVYLGVTMGPSLKLELSSLGA